MPEAAPAKPLSASSILGRVFSFHRRRPGWLVLFLGLGGLAAGCGLWLLFGMFFSRLPLDEYGYELPQPWYEGDAAVGAFIASFIAAQGIVTALAFKAIGNHDRPEAGRSLSWLQFVARPTVAALCAAGATLIIYQGLALFFRGLWQASHPFLALYIFNILLAWLVFSLMAEAAAAFAIAVVMHSGPLTALKEIRRLTRDRRLKIIGLFGFAPLFALSVQPFILTVCAGLISLSLPDIRGVPIFFIPFCLMEGWALATFPGLLAAAVYADLRALGAETTREPPPGRAQDLDSGAPLRLHYGAGGGNEEGRRII